MISGKRAKQSRGRANEFVGETKQTVPNQVEMEMLAGQKFCPPKSNEEDECEDIEGELDGNSGPARNAVDVLERVPGWRTGRAQTTAVEKTTDTAQADADGRDESEVVAGGAVVADMAFGQLDEDVTAEQCPKDGFAGGQLQPHVGGAEMEPAFGQKVDDFRAEECADQGGDIDENEAAVLAGAAFPEKKADDDAGEKERGIRRDGHWGNEHDHDREHENEGEEDAADSSWSGATRVSANPE